MSDPPSTIPLDSHEAFFNRELSWLAFARRVLAQVEDQGLPLLERVKFAGIVGMLHDEFFMKRMSGLRRQIKKGSRKTSLDGRQPQEELAACRDELVRQTEIIARLMRDDLRPAMRDAGVGLFDYDQLDAEGRAWLRDYFVNAVQPILTPLAVDAEHPFPFISNSGLNLAVMVPDREREREVFVRIKVPDNRPRWIALPDDGGFVPLEQVIAANLDLMFPASPPSEIHMFRVTRGAEGETGQAADLGEGESSEPGSIIRLVSNELKARRFAGVVRLQVGPTMPEELLGWLTTQLRAHPEDVYRSNELLGLADLLKLEVPDREDLRYPAHVPATPSRLLAIDPTSSAAIFDEIALGDILVHHPYDSFDTSVLRLLESAAVDPSVLAIKLTIYRTSGDSPIVRALAEASRRGKQVAVLVEITARFDEAPNIQWGHYLENEGVHVAYGVEQLKTHVKLALVVREEKGRIRRYAHIGTGNYHTGTARVYEDLGLLTCHREICEDVAAVFNELTGASQGAAYQRLIVAPGAMRARFVEMIHREVEHAKAGRPAGIHAKMNQLQDPEMIRELYRAGREGVPITLNVRGLCCLRPGVPGLSENIRVFSVVGRFLEHSRIYSFTNGGDPEYYIGSADWMKRNLENRVETITPILDPEVKRQLAEILETYEQDNSSAWDGSPDGSYRRRTPEDGEPGRAAQPIFSEEARRRDPWLSAPAIDVDGPAEPAEKRRRRRSPSRSARGPAWASHRSSREA